MKYPLKVEAITGAYRESDGDTQNLIEQLRRYLEVTVELINEAYNTGIKTGKRMQARKA